MNESFRQSSNKTTTPTKWDSLANLEGNEDDKLIKIGVTKLGNIKNRPLGPDFSYGSPGQAKLLQKQKLSITASFGIKQNKFCFIRSLRCMVELRSRLTLGNKNNPETWDYSIILAPPVRLELTTSKLTASCSTIELQGIVI